MIVTDIKIHYPGQSYSNNEMEKKLYKRDKEISDTLVKLGGKHFIDEIKSSDQFFPHLGVETRNVLCDPEDPMQWWNEYAGEDPFALEGAIAYEKLMQGKEPLGEDDRLIVIGNVADTSAPHIGYAVLAHLQRRHENFVFPSVIALLGEGCSGFISGLREANIYLSHKPNARVVILTVEMMATPLLNPWLQPALTDCAKHAPSHERKTMRNKLLGLAIQRYLFGEGCAAALCSRQGKGIEFNQFLRWANLDPEDIHLLELTGTNTKMQQVPPFGYFHQQPEKLIGRLIESYLPAASSNITHLPVEDYNFAVHTGSKKILDYVQSSIKISDNQIEPSRKILKTYGNMNATTGAAVLASIIENEEQPKVIAIFFGLGFALQLAY